MNNKVKLAIAVAVGIVGGGLIGTLGGGSEAPSYQYHHKRSEIWVIVKGTAEVKLDGEVKPYGVGDIIHIPVKSKHQAKNIGDDDLVFIEVQLGEYFGEDDIVRLEDKYGRV